MKRFVIIAVVLIVALGGALVLRDTVTNHDPPLVVVHWANSHPMRDGLLPQMAERFNDADHETDSGRSIKVVVVQCDSSVQTADLVARLAKGTAPDERCEGGNPTIVTPQSDDWLGDVNHLAGRTVVDTTKTESIARSWIGIVTYRDIASCLGWPGKEIGYQDIVDLQKGGWESLPEESCAKASWGPRPLLAFTNPNTSTTGRDVLISLFSSAADKAPGDLTTDDVNRPEVVAKVREFQQLVDHYMPGTIPLNTKIDQGKRYGHFFLMPEDNLVNLYKGNEKAIGSDGKEHPVKSVKDLVMIYPKEGSALNANPAGVVQAPWVSSEEAEAAQTWIDDLREDEQQRSFMAAGFRPGTEQPTGGAVAPKFGLDPNEPDATFEPGAVPAPVVQQIMQSWGQVKKPAVVTFVVDTSGSMEGRIDEAKKGLLDVLDNMADDNQIGLVTFSTDVAEKVQPAPKSDVQFEIAAAVEEMKPFGSTALYDAVLAGARMSERADADPAATRAVVVLSDGVATQRQACLDSLVTLVDKGERPVTWCATDQVTDPQIAVDRSISANDVRALGRGPLLEDAPRVQIFFVGFGEADIDVGRLLAQATSGEYVGSTDEDLAAVIADLGPYF
jgi:Ca-activated chloride channel family protein